MCRPPLPDLLPHPLHRWPSVTGQGEGRLGDQRIAGDDFKGSAGRVRVALVITCHHPHPTVIVSQPNLGTAQHMSSRMHAQRNRAETPLFAIVQPGKAVFTQAMAHDRQAEVVGQVMRTARAGVVRMGVGDHGGRHRTPRIDMKISRRTEQAFIGGNDDWITHAVRCPSHSSKDRHLYVGQSRRGDVTASRRSGAVEPQTAPSTAQPNKNAILRSRRLCFLENINVDMARICCKVHRVRKF